MDLELKVFRKWQVGKATQGRLLIDGIQYCFTEEDALRQDGVKIFGETCIPAGKYDVDVTYSQHFQKPLPLVLNVSGFAGVRIHSGNRPSDTEGCILVGQAIVNDAVSNSRLAFEPVFERIKEAVRNKQKVTIEIINDDGLIPLTA